MFLLEFVKNQVLQIFIAKITIFIGQTIPLESSRKFHINFNLMSSPLKIIMIKLFIFA